MVVFRAATSAPISVVHLVQSARRPAFPPTGQLCPRTLLEIENPVESEPASYLDEIGDNSATVVDSKSDQAMGCVPR